MLNTAVWVDPHPFYCKVLIISRRHDIVSFKAALQNTVEIDNFNLSIVNVRDANCAHVMFVLAATYVYGKVERRRNIIIFSFALCVNHDIRSLFEAAPALSRSQKQRVGISI